MKFTDIQIDNDYASALRPLTDRELGGLKREIAEAERVLDPLLFHLTVDGTLVFVDGHHRIRARSELIHEGVDIPVPPTAEVIELSGAEKPEVLEWITQHQRSRRNVTPLMATVSKGEEFIEMAEQGLTASQISQSAGMTPSQVTRAIGAARDMIELEQVAPSVAAAVADDPSVSQRGLNRAVKDATGVKPRMTPKGPLAAFKPLQATLYSLSRKLTAVRNEHGESTHASLIASKIDEIQKAMEAWENELA